jgi:hypothetical protein
MKNGVFGNLRMPGLLLVVAVFVMVMAPSGCDGGDQQIVINQSNNRTVQGGDTAVGVCKMDSGRGDRLQATVARVESTLKLNPDGTVSINHADPDYPYLAYGDEAFGNAVLADLNTYVHEGLAHVNPDFSVDWLAGVTSTNCSKHWWGEQCSVDASTTNKVCIGLEAGEGALLICDTIPVVDIACEVIEAVGSIPLEAEVCPCSDRGDSSTFHVTWVGVAWFKCN